MPDAQNIRDAIIECFRAQGGGPLSVRDVQEWVEAHYPRRWKDASTALADLTIGGNTSSSYREGDKCLIRVDRGVYRLAPAHRVGHARAGDEAPSMPPAAVNGAQPRSRDNAKGLPVFWIPGIPATFATTGEKPWRATLDSAIPDGAGVTGYSGVMLSFFVEGALHHGQPYDLDNLCEPVFSVFVNRKRWFGAARPNIQWWQADRTLATPAGCRIRVAAEPVDPPAAGVLLFSGVYRGEFPKGASDDRIARWLDEMGGPWPDPAGGYSIALEFGASGINVGNIASGPVKSIIDNLFPILGGKRGAPDDWRIQHLFVRKAMRGLGDDALRLSVRRTDEDG